MAGKAKPFERKNPSLKPQPRILVICEDTKSSLQYLKDAARYFRAYAEVDIVHCGKNDPLNIVREAVQRKRFFDHVYCAIDRDRHENFDEALDMASRNEKISVIASYPCYEFWLLLHFQKTRKPYVGVGNHSAGDLVIRDLCEAEGMARYAKGGADSLFEQLLDRLPKARQYAAQVMAEALAEGNLNPSTQLHELISCFEFLGQPPPVSQS